MRILEQCNLWHIVQVVVGRTGDQLLTSETGEITRYDGRFFQVDSVKPYWSSI